SPLVGEGHAVISTHSAGRGVLSTATLDLSPILDGGSAATALSRKGGRAQRRAHPTKIAHFAEQNELIPARPGGLIFRPPCSIEGVVDRGVRRRSKVRRSTYRSPRWSAGRRRALAPEGPRAPGPPPPHFTWVPESWRVTP